MSSVSQDVELINTDSPWRHWEMDRLDGRGNGGEKPSDSGRTDGGDDDTALSGDAAQTADAKIDQTATSPSTRSEDLAQERLEAKAEGYKEGFEKGRQDGFEAGLAAAQRQAQEDFERDSREALAPLVALAEEFSAAINSMSEDLSNQLVELALGIGNVMALDAIKEDEQIVNQSIRLILDSEIVSSGQPHLLLNPADLELVDAVHGDELIAMGWQLRGDDKVARGGCRVRSEKTEIDASLETRWHALTTRIRRRHEDRVPNGESSDQ